MVIIQRGSAFWAHPLRPLNRGPQGSLPYGVRWRSVLRTAPYRRALQAACAGHPPPFTDPAKSCAYTCFCGTNPVFCTPKVVYHNKRLTQGMNYAEILKSIFAEQVNAPIEAWEQFVEHCEFVHYKKDEVIKPQNTTERYFHFIIKGSAGIFLWKENNFVCLDFAFDQQFCADYMSLLSKEQTPLQVVVLENSDMLRMTASSFEKLTQKTVGSVIRLIAAELSFIDKQQQQIALLTQSAKERYDALLDRFPGLQNRIAQNHIASYLGITPQSLSRIRRQKK